MDIFKTNKQYWEELLKAGKLFSHTKDGLPNTPAKKALGYAYTIIVIALTIFSIIWVILLPKSQLKIRTFAVAMVLSTALGYIWDTWMLKADPTYPGWLMAPWAIVQKEFILTLEDILFFPACALLFYCIFRRLSIKGTPWTSPYGHYTVIGVYSILIIIALCITATAGRSEALLFGIPGVCMYIYARNTINIKRFLIFQIVILAIQSGWDLVAVSLIHRIPGFAWASQWIYISFDQMGNYYHSKVFLDYGTHQWAWILDNPVEITPWFGIVGGLFNYTFFAACDKLFYKNTNPI
ncbi:MAG: hypothetical protein JW795_08375 [Chitinivibrionales bacterium]|nr:hypothetical protein [Chitinivibrionales bacterium]